MLTKTTSHIIFNEQAFHLQSGIPALNHNVIAVTTKGTRHISHFSVSLNIWPKSPSHF